MHTLTRTVLTVGLFTCVVMSAVQAMASKHKGSTCEILDGACVSVNCAGECAPIFPEPCACIR